MATVRDTILAFPALDECEEYLEKVVLPNRSLDGAVEYTPSKDMKSVNLAAADMYAMIGNNPDFTGRMGSRRKPKNCSRRKGRFV